MLRYAVRKAGRLLLVLLGVSLLTFAMTFWIQGNPAELVLAHTGVDPTRAELAAVEEQLGINRSLPAQYADWMKNALRGDLGNSYITNRPVLEELAYRAPATVRLTLTAFLAMLLIAVPLGIFTAVRRDRFADYTVRAISFVFMASPGFVLGLLLCYGLSVRLKWFPMLGNGSWKHLVLPVMTLALPAACRYISIIRANLLEVLDEDYIFLLRSRGLRERVIMLGNALRNAFIPVVSLLGISLGNLLGGSVVVENLFSWPGLGSYLMSSINNRDYPVVLAYVLLMATAFVVINYLVDLAVCLMDPRITLMGERGR